jgi:glutamine phosphoribosylpyrophosphate amidotransferase
MYGFVKGKGDDFCDACFTGHYPVALADDTKVRQLHLFEASDR